MIRLVVICALFTAASQGPPLTATPPDQAVVQTDADLVIDQLRRSYRQFQRAEQVDVTADSGATKRSDSLTVRTWPDGRFEVELGPVRLWGDAGVIRAVHAANAGAYFEHAVDGRPLPEALRELLPPLPAPQLDLLLGPAHATSDLAGHARGIRWESGEISDTSGLRLRASGSFDKGTITVRAAGDPARLTQVEIDRPSEALRITLEISPLEESAREAPGIDIAGRAKAASLAELVPPAP